MDLKINFVFSFQDFESVLRRSPDTSYLLKAWMTSGSGWCLTSKCSSHKKSFLTEHCSMAIMAKPTRHLYQLLSTPLPTRHGQPILDTMGKLHFLSLQILIAWPQKLCLTLLLLLQFLPIQPAQQQPLQYLRQHRSAHPQVKPQPRWQPWHHRLTTGPRWTAGLVFTTTMATTSVPSPPPTPARTSMATESPTGPGEGLKWLAESQQLLMSNYLNAWRQSKRRKNV